MMQKAVFSIASVAVFASLAVPLAAQIAAVRSCPRLVEFSGEQADPADVRLPRVSGRVLIYYWSELEPKENKFDFSTMDREIGLWTGAEKSVVLRFSTAGWKKWKEPWSQQGTPQWVYKKYHIGSVTEVDGARLPVYWSPGYFTGLSRFLEGVNKHIQASPYRDKVEFIEIAVGDGGETKPDTEQNKTPEQRAGRLALWQRVGYTNAIWYETVARTISIYKSAFPSMPLALMPDASFLGGDCTLQNIECREKAIIALGSQAGVILQDNGFDRNHLYPEEWHYSQPLACEQLISATKQGYPLKDDLDQSVKAECRWLIVFREDLRRSDFEAQVRDFYGRCSQ